MRIATRTSLAIVTVGLAVSLGGCALLAPTSAASPTPSADREEAAQDDKHACDLYSYEWDKLILATQATSGVTWADAYERFALRVGIVATDAAGGSEVDDALSQMAWSAASSADAFATAGNLNTQQKLELRLAMKSAADACGMKVSFSD